MPTDEVEPTGSDLGHLLRVGPDGHSPQPVRGRKHAHPTGWVPGVRIDAAGGFIVTDPIAEAPTNWDEILDQLLPPGLDRSLYSVDGDTVEVRAWDANMGEGNTTRLYYFKARIRIQTLAATGRDLDDLIAAAKRARVRKAPAPSPVERCYWLHFTDPQAGQGDGDGVAGMVSRVLDLAELAAADLKLLRRSGRPATSILLPITGDLVEGVWGWYDMQTFSVELDRRDQTKLIRRLLTELILSLASHGLPVHVAVVPGNHGENRKDGKAYTSLGDNDDVAIVEQIADALQLSDRHGHVTFSFPEKNRLSLTVEVLGHIVGLTHGHIARGASGTAEAKLTRWFERMAAIRDPLGDSDLIFSGHYHHARFQQLLGDTLWVQGGALCDASEWFSQSLGLVSDPVVMKGTITRSQLVETLLPYSWTRSRPETVTIAKSNGLVTDV